MGVVLMDGKLLNLKRLQVEMTHTYDVTVCELLFALIASTVAVMQRSV